MTEKSLGVSSTKPKPSHDDKVRGTEARDKIEDVETKLAKGAKKWAGNYTDWLQSLFWRILITFINISCHYDAIFLETFVGIVFSQVTTNDHVCIT